MKQLAIKIKVGVLAQKDGKLLLIKERDNSDKKFYWNIIKGTFNFNLDKDIIDTAKREMQEEAGVKLKRINFLNVMFLRKKNKLTIQFNFYGDIKNNSRLLDKKQPCRKLECIKEIKLFSKKELKKLKPNDLISKRTSFLIKTWINNNFCKYLIKSIKSL